jgi:hypothetical protein
MVVVFVVLELKETVVVDADDRRGEPEAIELSFDAATDAKRVLAVLKVAFSAPSVPIRGIVVVTLELFLALGRLHASSWQRRTQGLWFERAESDCGPD